MAPGGEERMALVTKCLQNGFSIACEVNAEACETQRGPGMLVRVPKPHAQ